MAINETNPLEDILLLGWTGLVTGLVFYLSQPDLLRMRRFS